MCWRMWEKKTVSSELKFPAQETKNQETMPCRKELTGRPTCPLERAERVSDLLRRAALEAGPGLELQGGSLGRASLPLNVCAE